ncbi:MAG: hypothetical protein EP346_02845 [Bacteroidetes bacterium]|nr:MAG: hypothetical protein EP346_02845 [Bacteroidota bacterium]
MKNVVIAVLTGLTLASCSKSEVPESLTTLQSEVTEAMNMLSNLDSASIAEQYNKVKPYFEYLSTTDYDSTLKDVYIKDLTWLDRYQRAIFKWQGKHRSHLMELEESASQLKDLTHDAIYNQIDTNELRIFIKQERNAIEGVLRNIRTRGGEILFYGNGADSMATRLDSIFPDIQ